ncbi:MAG: hypothetical protein H0W72_05115 [Planctomycetes bacterium]|nr:hypothetical protein [Planctomycetota bacterium]
MPVREGLLVYEQVLRDAEMETYRLEVLATVIQASAGAKVKMPEAPDW